MQGLPVVSLIDSSIRLHHQPTSQRTLPDFAFNPALHLTRRTTTMTTYTYIDVYAARFQGQASAHPVSLANTGTLYSQLTYAFYRCSVHINIAHYQGASCHRLRSLPPLALHVQHLHRYPSKVRQYPRRTSQAHELTMTLTRRSHIQCSTHCELQCIKACDAKRPHPPPAYPATCALCSICARLSTRCVSRGYCRRPHGYEVPWCSSDENHSSSGSRRRVQRATTLPPESRPSTLI